MLSADNFYQIELYQVRKNENNAGWGGNGGRGGDAAFLSRLQRKALCNSWEATNVDSWLMNMGLKRNRYVYGSRCHASSIFRLRHCISEWW